MVTIAEGAGAYRAELRRTFDAAFAVEAGGTAPRTIDLLAVRVAGASYAVRVSEISALVADKPVTPLPTPVAELLGLANAGGTVVPVYDLGALLGHQPTAGAPRWMVVARGATPVGLAFDQLDGHLRVTGTPDVVTTGGQLRPIVSVPALLSRIAARAEGAAATKEH